MAGMATCTLTHVTEVPTVRDLVASLIDRDAIPQVLVRVGLAPALDATPPPTPRRPVGHVLQIHRGDMLDPSPTPCILVAIDGSQSAVDAALWAIDEAVERDVPLRLVYVTEPADPQAIDPQDHSRRIAEVAVRHALTAVESTERPVKIEVEILQGRPVQALLEAARCAVMLCVGARRPQARHAGPHRLDRGSPVGRSALPRGDRANPPCPQRTEPRGGHRSGRHTSRQRGVAAAVSRPRSAGALRSPC